MYFEKQRLQRCGMHAINNLLQTKAYETQTINALADSLRIMPPRRFAFIRGPHHRTRLLGDYDANVIIAALQAHGHGECSFHDMRNDTAEIDFPHLIGIVANVHTGRLVKLGSGRHWVALVRMMQEDGDCAVWYNLDSKLFEPEPIGGDTEMGTWLASFAATYNPELLLVPSHAASPQPEPHQ